MIDNDRLGDVEGAELLGSGDAPLGRVERVYRDDDSGQLAWAVLAVQGHARFVPLAEAELSDGALRVPYSADQVAASPEVDPDAGHVSRGQEADLYLHYGMDYDVSTLLHDQTAGPVVDESTDDGGQDEQRSDGPVAGDSAVRTGVLDVGTHRREPELAGASGGAPGGGSAATMGTGPGGSAMGNASLSSAAGTNANTDLSARDDLLTTTGSERSEGGGDVAGDSMIDIAGRTDQPEPESGPRHSDVQTTALTEEEATQRDSR